MNVTCPNCATVYRVDPAKVPESGVRARCSICSAVFAVQPDGAEPGPGAPAAAPAAAPPLSPARPIASPAHPPAAPPSPTAQPMPAGPASPGQPRSWPAGAPSTVGAAGARAAPVQPPAVSPAAPAPSAPAVPFAPTAPAHAKLGVAPPATGAPAPAAPAAPAAPRPGAGTRPVNPFLSQDPALKARRLARALISDMVVYHPAKRQEGLRDGNLRELFDEEIKKSWEEYAEQVGKDVADSTPYFREALNEILAGGRQIF